LCSTCLPTSSPSPPLSSPPLTSVPQWHIPFSVLHPLSVVFLPIEIHSSNLPPPPSLVPPPPCGFPLSTLGIADSGAAPSTASWRRRVTGASPPCCAGTTPEQPVQKQHHVRPTPPGRSAAGHCLPAQRRPARSRPRCLAPSGP
jgi:hypothetical protein